MRTATTSDLSRARILSACVPLLACLACGAERSAGEAPKSPEVPAADRSAAGAATTDASTAVGPTTTTNELPDAGAGAPARLPESHPAAGDAGTRSDVHAHEPGRGPADIRASVVAHRDQARACYDKALAEHPGIEGDLVIQWTIDPKGNVTQVSLDSARSQILEPSVAACIANVIKAIQFASSPGGYETKAFYPFNFHPHGAPRPATP
jgi:hypothetical protein